jgi:hypothetical protein
MLQSNHLTGFSVGASGPGLLAVRGVDFNGSTQYASRGAGLTGAADGSQGTISFWFRMDGGDGANNHFFTDDFDALRVYRDSSNRVQIRTRNVGGASSFIFATTGTTYTATGAWRHFIASWDTNFSAGNKLRQMYVNDASDAAAPTDGDAAFNIDYTRSNHFIGVDASASADYLNGCIAELWFAPTRIDLSVTANRRKFISATGKPMDLGATGANPTGSQPLVYQSIRSGGVVNDFLTNRGSGGNFSYTGSPTVSSDNPSD